MGKRRNDIERYLRGEMTPAEMHALEKEALHDPFLSDALEGANETGTDSFLFDLKELHTSVFKRTRNKRVRAISFSGWSLGIAATILLLVITSVYIISTMIRQQQHRSLALKQEAAHEKVTMTDSTAIKEPVPDPARDLQAEKKEDLKNSSQPVQQSPGNKARKPAPENPVRTPAQEPALAEAAVVVDQRGERADQSEAEKKITTLATGRTREAQFMPRIIKGKVTSAEDGFALPGVNVKVKGTNAAIVTDEEGNYEIAVTDPEQELQFSFIGLQSVERKPVDNSKLDVVMAPDYSQLSEIVVAGAPADGNALLQPAEPEGGKNAYQKYLEQKMKYPQQALENKIEGGVTVQFTVNASGQLEDFKVIKGLGYGCEDEVIRLIKEGPAWMPSRRNAQPVKDKVKVRLKFDLPD